MQKAGYSHAPIVASCHADSFGLEIFISDFCLHLADLAVNYFPLKKQSRVFTARSGLFNMTGALIVQRYALNIIVLML